MNAIELITQKADFIRELTKDFNVGHEFHSVLGSELYKYKKEFGAQTVKKEIVDEIIVKSFKKFLNDI